MRATPAEELRKSQARSLGYVLIRCGQLFNERGMARANSAAGRPVLREAHTRLLPHLQTAGGIRVTELARRLGITKQGAQQLVADMAGQGVVRVEVDPDDKRARRVSLTGPGYTAMMHGTGLLLEIEAELAPRVGKAKLRELRGLLTDLLSVLESDAS